jgi:RNA-binding protein
MSHPTDLTSRQKKTLRQVAHHLDPVVIVGERGISEGVLEETGRALSDHELIKVRVADNDREARAVTTQALASATESTVVQKIGKVVVLYRPNPKANPQLSNISRYLGERW